MLHLVHDMTSGCVCLYVQDLSTRTNFLIDKGTDVSLLLLSLQLPTIQPAHTILRAVIAAFTLHLPPTMALQLNFLIADVLEPVIGIDFLTHHQLHWFNEHDKVLHLHHNSKLSQPLDKTTVELTSVRAYLQELQSNLMDSKKQFSHCVHSVRAMSDVVPAHKVSSVLCNSAPAMPADSCVCK